MDNLSLMLDGNSILYKFYEMTKLLTAEKNIESLLKLIVENSMEITSSDAATIYTIIDRSTQLWSYYDRDSKSKMLKFMIARNNSFPIELESQVIDILDDSIIGATVLRGEPLRIEDAYNIPEDLDIHFNVSFDKQTGYTTKSIMTIPMKDYENRILGVIELINKKTDNGIVPFSSSDEIIAYSFAGQAATALENTMLYKDMNELLEKYRGTMEEEIMRRKNSDEEINKLLSAVEHSPVCIIITDPDGRILYVNPKFEELTGYTMHEVYYNNPRILKSGRQSKEDYARLWQELSSGNSWQGELYNRKKNGEYYWANCNISSVKNTDGSIKYFIGIQEDITEKKKLVDELEKKNQDLSDTIRQLNYTQAQLIQQEKLAGIGQLAAGVAHEINTPIGFIMSNFSTLTKYVDKIRSFISDCKDARAMEKEHIPPDIEELEKKYKMDFIMEDIPSIISESKEGLDKVSDIVKALREFTAIDHSEGMEAYDLNEAVENTLLLMQSAIGSGIVVNKNYGSLPFINAIGKEINQVIINLISNSVYYLSAKFNDESGGVIDIRTYSENDHIFLEIQDNGPGIDGQYKDRIFEPFFTTKPVGSGSGLGLSTAYDVIVNKHCGKINFETEPGTGTKFIITLPLDMCCKLSEE